jgi:hypothetical protein
MQVLTSGQFNSARFVFGFPERLSASGRPAYPGPLHDRNARI